MGLMALYEFADTRQIDIDWYSMSRAESLSIRMDDGTCAIAVDPWHLTSVADEMVKLAHELGHCETGSFYNLYSPFDIRQKHENRADKWAIKKLVPEDELDQAVAAGCTDLWSLADHFGVTEEFMKKAVCWYTHGNLATELYF